MGGVVSRLCWKMTLVVGDWGLPLWVWASPGPLSDIMFYSVSVVDCEGFNDLGLKRSGCCAVGSIPWKEKLQWSPILAFTKVWIWHDSAIKVSRVRMHCFKFYLLQTIYLSFRSVLLIPNKMLAHLHDPLRASQIARSALQSQTVLMHSTFDLVWSSIIPLLHSDRLGQIPREVDVETLAHGEPVRDELQGDDVQ